MKQACYAFLLFFTAQLHCGFIAFHIFEHSETHQKIILIGDRHDIDIYTIPNRAAIINLAHTLNAHVIVEDPSDTSLVHKYSKEISIFPIVNAKCLFDKKIIALKSLSLTHHCTRKKISVQNLEFRQFIDSNTRFFRKLHIVPSESSFLDMTASLKRALDPRVATVLDTIHTECIENIDYAGETKTDYFLRRNSNFLTHAYFLDVLIVDNIITITRMNPTKPIIICAGNAHIDGLLPLLNNMGYICTQSVPQPIGSEEFSGNISEDVNIVNIRKRHYFPEIELLPYFQGIIPNNAPLKTCITERSIKRNDAWRIARAYLVEGEPAALALKFCYSMMRKLFK